MCRYENEWLLYLFLIARARLYRDQSTPLSQWWILHYYSSFSSSLLLPLLLSSSLFLSFILPSCLRPHPPLLSLPLLSPSLLSSALDLDPISIRDPRPPNPVTALFGPPCTCTGEYIDRIATQVSIDGLHPDTEERQRCIPHSLILRVRNPKNQGPAWVQNSVEGN